jgi:hypothetical protein
MIDSVYFTINGDASLDQINKNTLRAGAYRNRGVVILVAGNNSAKVILEKLDVFVDSC